MERPLLTLALGAILLPSSSRAGISYVKPPPLGPIVALPSVWEMPLKVSPVRQHDIAVTVEASVRRLSKHLDIDKREVEVNYSGPAKGLVIQDTTYNENREEYALHDVLTELVTNAIKYSYRGGTVSVRLAQT